MFQDLTPETLQKRRELKEITSALKDANICHRWATPLKLQILYKGKSLFIQLEEKGVEVFLKHTDTNGH